MVCGREFDSYLDRWNAKVKEFYATAAVGSASEELKDRSGTANDTAHSPSSAAAASEEQPE